MCHSLLTNLIDGLIEVCDQTSAQQCLLLL